MPLHDSIPPMTNKPNKITSFLKSIISAFTPDLSIKGLHSYGNQVTSSTFNILNNFFGSQATALESKFLIEGYAKNPYVKMTVDKIAQVTARLKRKVTGQADLVALYERPNNDQNQQEFDEELTAYLEVTGDAFSVLVEPIGFEGTGIGAQWINLASDRVIIKVDDLNMVTGYEYSTPNGRKIIYEPKDVMHNSFSNIVTSSNTTAEESKRGMSPLKALWTTVEASNDVRDAWSAIHKNRGAIGFLTNKSEVPLLPDDQERVQEQLDITTGGAKNANRVIATNGDMSFIQMSMSPTDLKLLESDENNKRIITAGYGLDSSLFNDPENKTFANRKNADKSAYTDVYIPLAEKIDNQKIRFLESRGGTITIELDTTDIEALKTDEQVTMEAEVELGVVRTDNTNQNIDNE